MAPKEAFMSPDEHKAIVRASYEVVFNQHQVDRADEFYAPDYLDHAAAPGQAPGLAGAKQKRAAYIAAGHARHRTTTPHRPPARQPRRVADGSMESPPSTLSLGAAG
jgi:hypothetical protein